MSSISSRISRYINLKLTFSIVFVCHSDVHIQLFSIYTKLSKTMAFEKSVLSIVAYGLLSHLRYLYRFYHSRAARAWSFCNEMYHNVLKLYCRYLYTRPCLINHIWGLKQLWLQVNGHAWFHFQRLRWPVRNGEGAKNSKWKYMSPAGFEPTPRQSTKGKLQRLRPLGHAG